MATTVETPETSEPGITKSADTISGRKTCIRKSKR